MKHVRLLSKSDYREFNHNCQVLQSQGYDLPHLVEHQHDGRFKITLNGEHLIQLLKKHLVLKEALMGVSNV
jgi:hypothetical protein